MNELTYTTKFGFTGVEAPFWGQTIIVNGDVDTRGKITIESAFMTKGVAIPVGADTLELIQGWVDRHVPARDVILETEWPEE